MYCSGVDDGSEELILESPFLCIYNNLATSVRLNSFLSFLHFPVDNDSPSILRCNGHDLTDIVLTFQLFPD